MVEDLEAFRVVIKRQVKVDLPYDIKGLQILEMIMETGFSDTVLCGAFIGEVIVRNLGGTWKMVTPREQSYIEAPNGNAIRPFELASGKVEGGKGYSLVQQYQAVGAQYAS